MFWGDITGTSLIINDLRLKTAHKTQYTENNPINIFSLTGGNGRPFGTGDWELYIPDSDGPVMYVEQFPMNEYNLVIANLNEIPEDLIDKVFYFGVE